MTVQIQPSHLQVKEKARIKLVCDGVTVVMVEILIRGMMAIIKLTNITKLVREVWDDIFPCFLNHFSNNRHNRHTVTKTRFQTPYCVTVEFEPSHTVTSVGGLVSEDVAEGDEGIGAFRLPGQPLVHRRPRLIFTRARIGSLHM